MYYKLKKSPVYFIISVQRQVINNSSGQKELSCRN